MSWKIQAVIDQREEFVTLARGGTTSMVKLCQRFGISRKTGYKWLGRFAAGGLAALANVVPARRRTANQTVRALEAKVVALRRAQPTWGPRKLRRRLQDTGQAAVPAVSTCARILARAHLVARVRPAPQPCLRFSRAEPNQLWQMDFKGHFALQRGGRCHPFTVLDDCSRYALGLQACGNEQACTVQSRLQQLFQRYGLPEELLCDNGAPWAGPHGTHTTLTVWLLRLGVRVLHGRPRHPQTQGKEERFHRTLKTDLLARHDWRDLPQAQARFDRYRRLYNHDRPHEALALAVPASHYRPSSRSWPARLPPIEYDHATIVRVVKGRGDVMFRNRCYQVGEAFAGLLVALLPTATDGLFRLAFQAHTLGLVDLRTPCDRPKNHTYPLLPPPGKVSPSTRNTCYP